MNVLEQIEKTINENPVVLYMKGTPISHNVAFPAEWLAF